MPRTDETTRLRGTLLADRLRDLARSVAVIAVASDRRIDLGWYEPFDGSSVRAVLEHSDENAAILQASGVPIIDIRDTPKNRTAELRHCLAAAHIARTETNRDPPIGDFVFDVVTTLHLFGDVGATLINVVSGPPRITLARLRKERSAGRLGP